MSESVAERLKDACYHMHPSRGLMVRLRDGSLLSIDEYKTLRRQDTFWFLRAGLR